MGRSCATLLVFIALLLACCNGFLLNRCSIRRIRNVWTVSNPDRLSSHVVPQPKVWRPPRPGGKRDRLSWASREDLLAELGRDLKQNNLTNLQRMFSDPIYANQIGWYVSKLLPQMSGGTLQSFWKDFILHSEHHAGLLDQSTHTMAMSLLNRRHRHDSAVLTFEAMRRRGWNSDLVAYNCAIRAAGYCRPYTYTTALLDDAYTQLGNASLAAADAAMIDLRHVPAVSPFERRVAVQHAWDLLRWVEQRGMRPSSRLLNSAVAVVCARGTDADCEAIMQYSRKAGVAPTVHTYNLLLDRSATRRNQKQASDVVLAMAREGIAPDEVTYNTLLKLCVNRNDSVGANKVVAAMNNTGHFAISNVTLALLARLQRSRAGALNAMLDSTVGLTMPSGGPFGGRFDLIRRIDACRNTTEALRLLNEAQQRDHASTAVHVAVAKCFARHGDYRAALAHMDQMLSQGLDLDKFGLSAALSIAGQAGDGSSVERYVQMCMGQYPHLLTQAVWYQVANTLSADAGPAMAARLLTKAVDRVPGMTSRIDCQLMNRLMKGIDAVMQAAFHSSSRSSSTSSSSSTELAQLCSLAAYELLLGLCQALRSSGTSGREVCEVVHPYVFNDVMRLLGATGLADKVPDVCTAMRAKYPVHAPAACVALPDGAFGSPGEPNSNTSQWNTTAPQELLRNVSSPGRAWRRRAFTTSIRPTNYTTALLVQNGRQRGDVGFVAKALRWAMEEAVTVPFYVISDALSFAYNEGRTDLTYDLYRELYRAGQLTHWATYHHPQDHRKIWKPRRNHDRPAAGTMEAALTGTGQAVLDLHAFSRGMAYAAIKTALEEVSGLDEVTELIVITGQGISRAHRHVTDLPSSPPPLVDEQEGPIGEEPKQQPFRLVDTVQDMLIEDFNPPISSSTAPENPGRVVIKLRA